MTHAGRLVTGVDGDDVIVRQGRFRADNRPALSVCALPVSVSFSTLFGPLVALICGASLLLARSAEEDRSMLPVGGED